MLLMDDIIREGHPTLRKVAEPFEFPLKDEDKKLAADMREFLANSQDEELAEKYHLRGGVGLAAPQLDISKQLIALLVPGVYEDDEPILDLTMVNPKIISHSVQSAALADGEGCLSVDRDVPGYVVRHNRITVRYYDLEGEEQEMRLKNYPAIVVQHEIDHLHGIMFYDYIDEEHPFVAKDDVIIIN